MEERNKFEFIFNFTEKAFTLNRAFLVFSSALTSSCFVLHQQKDNRVCHYIKMGEKQVIIWIRKSQLQENIHSIYSFVQLFDTTTYTMQFMGSRNA